MDDLNPGLLIVQRARTPQVGKLGRSNRTGSMAHGAIARIFGAAEFYRSCSGARRWRIERGQGKVRLCRQLLFAPELEHEKPAYVANRAHVVDQFPVDRQSESAAPSGEDCDILFAINRIGDGRGDNARLRGETPQAIPGRGIIGGKVAARIALEDEPATCRQNAAVPWPGMFDRPARLLRYRIPGDEPPLDRSLHFAPDTQIGRQIARAQIVADVETAGPVGFPVRFGRIEHRRFECGNVHEVFARVVSHGMPVVPAKRPRHDQRRFAGDVDARFRVHLRPAVGAHPGRPVERDIGFGGNEFARGAIENVEIAVLRRLHQHLSIPPADLHVGQDNVLGRGEIPRFPRCRLIVPDIFPGIGPDGDDTGQIEVVAFAGAVGAGAAIGAVPRAAIANPDIEQIEIRIIGHGIPHGPAAADPVFARKRIAAPGGLSCLQIFGRVIAIVARHSVKTPELVTVLRIIGRNIAAYAEFGAAIADQHLAIDHARGAGYGVAFGLIDGDLFPDDFAGIAIECDKPPVQRAEKKRVPPGGEPAIDHIAASLHAGFAGYLGIVAPQCLPGRGIEGEDLAPCAGDVEFAVHHQRGRFLPAGRIHVGKPGKAEPGDVFAVYLVERRKALFGICAAMRNPVRRIVGCIDQPHIVYAACRFFGRAHTASRQDARKPQRGQRRPTDPSHRSLPRRHLRRSMQPILPLQRKLVHTLASCNSAGLTGQRRDERCATKKCWPAGDGRR